MISAEDNQEDLAMGLLFNDGGGRESRNTNFTPVRTLRLLLTNARSQREAGRTLHQLKQLLTEHPELSRHVPENLKNRPRLVIDNEQGTR